MAEKEKYLEVCKSLYNLTNNRNPGKSMQLKINSNFARFLCETVSEIFEEEENVVKIEGKTFIIGDLHGQIEELCYIIKECFPVAGTKFLFLGDYVDRGRNSIEVICLLFSLKVLYPDRFFLLRGNHESRFETKKAGFLAECSSKMNKRIWDPFCDAFDTMPLCAIVNNSCFCVHGGISQYAMTIDEINKIDRFCEIPESGPMMDLTWSDPDPTAETFKDSRRGKTFGYGKKATDEFLEKNGLKYLIRAHECVSGGYEYNFGDNKVITVFSASCYIGNEESKAAYIIFETEPKPVVLPRFASAWLSSSATKSYH